MSIPYPDFVAGTTISSSQVDANNADIVAEISNSIAADGTTTLAGNIPFSNFKITTLGAGSAAGDSANLGQVQAQAYIWCSTAGGTQNALTFTPSPAITAYAAGQLFRGKIGASSTNNAATLAVSGLTTKAIQSNGAALSSTVILETGKWYDFLYDGTAFQVSKYQVSEGTYAPLTGKLSQFAATTSSELAGVLSDETGSGGGFVRATAPTITTPVIVGIGTGAAASAGNVGEVLTASAASGSVSLTNTTPANVTSLSITAGQWLVTGTADILASGNSTLAIAGISATSATFPSTESGALTQSAFAVVAAGRQVLTTGPVFINISGTTTYYLVAQSNFSTSTATVGGTITAIRVR